MLLVTKQLLIQNAAERFREANQRRGEWIVTPDGRDTEAIYQQLRALPSTAGEAEIAAIIGDNRLTVNICDECHEDSESVVVMAIEIHHPTDMVSLCQRCLEQALQLASA